MHRVCFAARWIRRVAARKCGEAGGSATLWSYDDNARLLGAARFDPSGTETAQISDTYGAAGNRLSQSSSGQTTSYSDNTLDQLTSTDTNHTRGAATTS